MNILIVNSGSSSIKFQLIKLPAEVVVASGMLERIGQPDALIKYQSGELKLEEKLAIDDHTHALNKITALLLDKVNGPIDEPTDIDAIGHRVVHGGNTFKETCLIDSAVMDKIDQNSMMAPLHNPHNLKGIELTKKLFPKAHQVAVFDTAFHQTIPEYAHKYAIPNTFYKEQELKVYGFHGTSHAFVVRQAFKYLGREVEKVISIHLGNGCSITAIKEGKSIDTSLGFGPSNGLIMGTRSGDIDHSLIFYLVNNLGYALDDIKKILDKESGMYGLTGYSDLREIQKAAAEGDPNSILALQMNAYRIKKYIGAYSAAMNGLDAVIFTAGIGENSAILRDLVCKDMEYLGISLDNTKNEARSELARDIDSGDLGVKILVIPTNEELEIARQTYELINTPDQK